MYRFSSIASVVAYAVLPIIVTVAAHANIKADTTCMVTCNELVRCYPYYQPDNEAFYTIEDGVCKVFANGCVFSSNNCQRQNQCLPELEVVTKAKCKEVCAVCDGVENKTVCATFTPEPTGPSLSTTPATASEIRYQVQYPNKCEADRAACLSGIPYAFINEGNCLAATA